MDTSVCWPNPQSALEYLAAILAFKTRKTYPNTTSLYRLPNWSPCTCLIEIAEGELLGSSSPAFMSWSQRGEILWTGGYQKSIRGLIQVEGKLLRSEHADSVLSAFTYLWAFVYIIATHFIFHLHFPQHQSITIRSRTQKSSFLLLNPFLLDPCVLCISHSHHSWPSQASGDPHLQLQALVSLRVKMGKDLESLPTEVRLHH